MSVPGSVVLDNSCIAKERPMYRRRRHQSKERLKQRHNIANPFAGGRRPPLNEFIQFCFETEEDSPAIRDVELFLDPPPPTKNKSSRKRRCSTVSFGELRKRRQRVHHDETQPPDQGDSSRETIQGIRGMKRGDETGSRVYDEMQFPPSDLETWRRSFLKDGILPGRLEEGNLGAGVILIHQEPNQAQQVRSQLNYGVEHDKKSRLLMKRILAALDDDDAMALRQQVKDCNSALHPPGLTEKTMVMQSEAQMTCPVASAVDDDHREDDDDDERPRRARQLLTKDIASESFNLQDEESNETESSMEDEEEDKRQVDSSRRCSVSKVMLSLPKTSTRNVTDGSGTSDQPFHISTQHQHESRLRPLRKENAQALSSIRDTLLENVGEEANKRTESAASEKRNKSVLHDEQNQDLPENNKTCGANVTDMQVKHALLGNSDEDEINFMTAELDTKERPRNYEILPDPVLLYCETEYAYLVEESKFALRQSADDKLDWNFIYTYASPSLRMRLRSSELVREEVMQAFLSKRQRIANELKSGVRRKIMAHIIAMIRMFRWKLDTLSSFPTFDEVEARREMEHRVKTETMMACVTENVSCGEVCGYSSVSQKSSESKTCETANSKGSLPLGITLPKSKILTDSEQEVAWLCVESLLPQLDPRDFDVDFIRRHASSVLRSNLPSRPCRWLQRVVRTHNACVKKEFDDFCAKVLQCLEFGYRRNETKDSLPNKPFRWPEWVRVQLPFDTETPTVQELKFVKEHTRKEMRAMAQKHDGCNSNGNQITF